MFGRDLRVLERFCSPNFSLVSVDAGGLTSRLRSRAVVGYSSERIETTGRVKKENK